MTWRISIFIMVLIGLASCKEKKQEETPVVVVEAPVKPATYTSLDHLIEAEELKEILHEPTVKIVHFGREKQYKEGHIEGALNVWRTDITDASYPYGGMMCSKNQLENLLSSKGIQTNDLIVVYDHVASCDAARFWWVLENYGFQNIKILNGGIDSWSAIGEKRTRETPIVAKSNFKLPQETPLTSYVDKEEMVALIDREIPPVILDTRTLNEYTGLRRKKGAKRGGRIPGSTFMDWANAVNHSGDKKFKSYKDLEAMYAGIIHNKEEPVIAYCHSGVRSAHTTFVLTELLGYKNVRNYDGSWTEWSQFKEYAKERDSITTILQ